MSDNKCYFGMIPRGQSGRFGSPYFGGEQKLSRWHGANAELSFDKICWDN